MSRETDSSSSGSDGRGGPVYPPGTGPYGSADGPAGPPDRGAPGPDPDAEARAERPGKSNKGGKGEPKTETTLTTRIRINIPGSRPIPPVVMRKPVGDEDASAEEAPDAERPGAPGAASMAGGGADRGADGGSPGGAGAPDGADGGFSQGTSDWFAPRRTPKAEPDPGRGADPDATFGGLGGARRADAPYRPDDDYGDHGDGAGGSTPYDGRPDPYGQADPYGRSGADAYADPYGDPYARPYQDHADTPADGFPEVGLGPEDTSAGFPYSGLSGLPDADATGAMPVVPDPSAAPGTPSGTMGPPRPVGPTTGPAEGDMPLGPPDDDLPRDPTFGLGTGPVGFGGESGPTSPISSLYTQGTGPRSGSGAPGADDRPGGGPYGGGGGHVTSDTLVGGIPRVPSDGSDHPGGPAAGPGGAGPDQDLGGPDAPGAHDEPPARDDRPEPPPASKGRSKLVLVGAGLVGVLGLAYGAGLLLDHADVPNGTTVLGVDIGGKEKQAAVDTLDAELGDRVTAPLTIVADGQKSQLKPTVAGLSIDTEATVRDAAGRDYNPVSVIGSLFGGSREADAAVEVDEEKLEAELATLGTGSDAAGPRDGMVKFTNGKAVGVPGKPYKGIDTGEAVSTIEDAYRDRAATGENAPINLPVSTQQPKIGEREIQAAVRGFGKTAMSGWVWLKAGDVEVPFSEKTIGTFLTMRAGGSSLQPVIDPEALQKTYGTAFDGVVVEGGAGTVEMTPKHAAAAMLQALREPAPAEPDKRVAEVEGARSK